MEGLTATDVIGRAAELGVIQEFLADIEHGPRALVLSGEAGIGKTVLWEAGVDDARGRFDSILTCRGVEAEASLSFAGLSELLGDVLDEVGPSLAPPRRRALEVALLLAEPGETAPDPHAIGLAVLDVLRALADRGPCLVALDDIQWLDPASAGVLQIALRRLRDEPLGLLATLRLGPELGGSPVELERSFPDERLERLTVGPLSLAALHRLLEERLGLELTRPELARVQEATAGNPFFALELGRELVRTNTRPAPGQPLRVPESLRELLGGRLARLPGETLDVLLLVAALARPTVELVAATYGERERVLEALEDGAEEAVVELDDANVRFAHPLLGSICYERAPLWKRRAVHRALAGAVSDVEERARHLALAADGPDRVAASELEAAVGAGGSARGARGGGRALGARRRADGGRSRRSQRRRRFRAADLHRLAGDGEQAVAMLGAAPRGCRSGLERSDVLFELAVSQVGGARPRSSAATRHWPRRRATTRGLPGSWLFEPECTCCAGRRVDAALSDARAAVERAERAGDPTVLAASDRVRGAGGDLPWETTPGCSSAASRSRRSSDWSSSGTGQPELRARAPAGAHRGDGRGPGDPRATSRRKRRREGTRSPA